MFSGNEGSSCSRARAFVGCVVHRLVYVRVTVVTVRRLDDIHLTEMSLNTGVVGHDAAGQSNLAAGERVSGLLNLAFRGAMDTLGAMEYTLFIKYAE